MIRFTPKRIAISRWRSPAWPQGSGQPDYLNAVVSGDFNQGPEALLALLHQIEAEQGRVRSVPNAARTLDLDLLVFGEVVSDTETLKLPHPRMLERTFVLLPASEIEMRWLEYLRLFSEEQIRSTRYVGPW